MHDTLLHGFRRCFIRRDARRYSNYFVAGFVHGFPRSGSDSRENCCSKGCTFFGSNDFYFVGIDVGLNLAP